LTIRRFAALATLLAGGCSPATEPLPTWTEPATGIELVHALEVDRFLRALDAASPGERFRLPTEAEWEYACRAGEAGGPSPADWTTTDEANYDGRFVLPGQPRGEYRGRTTAVGSFAANAWGLHDLLGNVWEWTADEHCRYPDGSVSDPLARCGAAGPPSRGEP
jgi:formylglycine-generating enzyme required for sulfatase activity